MATTTSRARAMSWSRPMPAHLVLTVALALAPFAAAQRTGFATNQCTSNAQCNGQARPFCYDCIGASCTSCCAGFKVGEHLNVPKSAQSVSFGLQSTASTYKLKTTDSQPADRSSLLQYSHVKCVIPTPSPVTAQQQQHAHLAAINCQLVTNVTS